VHNDWLALIGDAAHALVPFLGQGLNSGLEDCSVLGDCIDRSPDDWPTALQEYHEERRENCEAVTRMAEEHYEELARAARDPEFIVRTALAEQVHGLAPDVFESVYSMVAFGNRPYSEIERLKNRNEKVLDSLLACPGVRDGIGSNSIGGLILATLEKELDFSGAVGVSSWPSGV
jgi:kynurenine 3-monooxygenase